MALTPGTVLRAVNSEPMARSTVSASSTMPAAPWDGHPCHCHDVYAVVRHVQYCSTVLQYLATRINISGKRVYNIVPSGKMLPLPKDGSQTTE